MTVGTIARIHRYPVKSMGGESLLEATVASTGILGDRAYALFDPVDRRVASAKRVAEFPRLLDFRARYLGVPSLSHPSPIEIVFPDGRCVRSDDDACRDALSAWFGRPLGLGQVTDDASIRPLAGRYAMTGTFLDYASLHVVTTAAMTALSNASPGMRVDIERFRPNLVIATPPGAGYPENGWVGAELRVGDSILARITDPCPRCAMTTFAQGELPQDPSVLKTIARENTTYAPVLASDQPCLGAYAFVTRGGVVRVGDEVRLHGAGDP